MAGSAILIHPMTDAVVNVDVQKTFMPGGGLPVTDGHLIIPVVQRVNLLFPPGRRYFTLDKHPKGHISLASSYVGLAPGTKLTAEEVERWTDTDDRIAPQARFNLHHLRAYLSVVGFQVLWPDHGIIGAEESRLHPDLDDSPCRIVLVKGTDPRCDSYSALRDNLGRPTGLGDLLKQDGVSRLFLTGLAFDFCVGWTALDAVKEGFEAVIVKDATRPVGLPGTVEKMCADLAAAGVRVVQSEDLVVGGITA
jgi:nicotinamidase/pyrazinamidase